MNLMLVSLVVQVIVLGLAMWIGNVMSKRLVQMRDEQVQLRQRIDDLETEVNR